MTHSRLQALIAFASITLLAACSDDPRPGYTPGSNNVGGAGPTTEHSDCHDIASGCTCEIAGTRAACGTAYSQVGDQTSCGPGEMVCNGGYWSDCAVNFALSSGSQKTSLSPSGSCNNSCSPDCHSFTDDPSQLQDGEGDGVVVTTTGVSLPGKTGPAPGACSGGDTGSCAHSICATGNPLSLNCDATAPGQTSCVSDICAAQPSCCNASWDASCVALIDSLCSASCFANSEGECLTCFKDSQDHDGDGYSHADGDCFDCDIDINPGAYDYPGNGMDEDCDGSADNEPSSCDQGLSLSSSDPFQHARAIELCRVADPLATGSNRRWGVLEAALVQANGSSPSHYYGRAITSTFGNQNTPRAGSRMAVYSSGTARAPGQSGYVNPNGQYGSYNAQTSCAYPAGFPKNAAGCPTSGGTANDSSGLRMKIRVPTNAQGFRYNFKFLSSEYPEWVCTAYNDHFVALMTSNVIPPLPAATSNNISFDANGNAASVNIALFTVPGCPTCGSVDLQGTGFDGTCGSGQSCGGGTDWLVTSAPVMPGEDLVLHFSIWDQGDHSWDSTVMIDNWQWQGEPTELKTVVDTQEPATIYTPGTFVRDYDASGVCPAGYDIVWGHWSWVSTTPSDSKVTFAVRTASSQAGLGSAPTNSLLFSNPPGPSSLAGTTAVAKAGNPDTQNGALVVDETLQSQGRPRHEPFLRVISTLDPSSNGQSTPTLHAWNMQFECVASE